MKYPGVCMDTEKRRWQARINTDSGRKHLGYYSDWFEALCARKAAENENLRDCPYCDGKIPRISSKGTVLKGGHYAQKKTCGKRRCQRQALRVSSQTPRYVPSGPMDFFIYGMAK